MSEMLVGDNNAGIHNNAELYTRASPGRTGARWRLSGTGVTQTLPLRRQLSLRELVLPFTVHQLVQWPVARRKPAS